MRHDSNRNGPTDKKAPRPTRQRKAPELRAKSDRLNHTKRDDQHEQTAGHRQEEASTDGREKNRRQTAAEEDPDRQLLRRKKKRPKHSEESVTTTGETAQKNKREAPRLNRRRTGQRRQD